MKVRWKRCNENDRSVTIFLGVCYGRVYKLQQWNEYIGGWVDVQFADGPDTDDQPADTNK